MKRHKGNIIHSWYRWYLDQKFIKNLNTYGKIPSKATYENFMETMQENDQLKQQFGLENVSAESSTILTIASENT